MSDVQLEGFDEWRAWLSKQEAGGVARMKDRVLRTAGYRGLEYAHDLAPIREGTLRGSLTVGGPGNVFNVVVGEKSYAVLGTALEYAAAVNDGHKQTPGRFIPGYWEGDKFVYDRSAEGGLVLKAEFVEGSHFFEKAMEYLKDDMDQILMFEMQRLFAELGG